MNRKILFSPVGGTDPMSETNLHDGALLHISRHYKPDVIYLYMSQDILQKQDKDNRYRYCLRKLGEKLNHVFEIVVIERRELTQVQLFDPIYNDFEAILDEIIGKMDATDELLLNMSSGTPAMKSALLVLATMTDIPCQCIQVNTPTKAMNRQEHSEVYDPAERWKLNPDNYKYKPGDENYDRTHPEKLISLKRLKYEEVIKEYVSHYNYHAALVLAHKMKGEYTVPYVDKLALADARQQLDFATVDALIEMQDAAIYSPVRRAESRMVYEYMLALQAKVARAEYADFVRGLSPIFTDLFEGILLKQAHFDIANFTSARENMLQWDLKKLRESEKIGAILDNAYHGKFEGKWVQAAHLAKLGEALIQDTAIQRCIAELRKVEASVRNMAAHNMISVSDEWIKKKTSYTSNEIVFLIREAFSYTSHDISESDWNSYNDMNEDIIKAI